MTTKIMTLAKVLGDLIGFRGLPRQARDLGGLVAQRKKLTYGQFRANRAFDTEKLYGKPKDYRKITALCCRTDNRFGAFISIAAITVRLH